MRIGAGIRTTLGLMRLGEWVSCQQLRSRMYAPPNTPEETFTYLRRAHSRGFVERRGERGAVEWQITPDGRAAIRGEPKPVREKPRSVRPRPLISSVWQLGAMG